MCAILHAHRETGSPSSNLCTRSYTWTIEPLFCLNTRKASNFLKLFPGPRGSAWGSLGSGSVCRRHCFEGHKDLRELLHAGGRNPGKGRVVSDKLKPTDRDFDALSTRH